MSIGRSTRAPHSSERTSSGRRSCSKRRSTIGRRDAPRRDAFRFLYVSTDEVFGDAAPNEAFNEESPFRPNSPYAASKAGADHLVRAASKTFGLPTVTLHPANVLGPYQLPEKLIPLITLRAAAREPLPIYGDGLQERDWFFVDDLCIALNAVLTRGAPGERYVVGGGGECWTNLRIAETICDLVDAIEPPGDAPPRRTLITHVADRPGHDRRYALDCAKIERDLGWRRASACRKRCDRPSHGILKTARGSIRSSAETTYSNAADFGSKTNETNSPLYFHHHAGLLRRL